MKTEKTSPGNKSPNSTERKLRNVRTCLYILVLAAITKIAMTDFHEVSFKPWINVAIMFLIILLVVCVEKSLRKKLNEEKEKKERYGANRTYQG